MRNCLPRLSALASLSFVILLLAACRTTPPAPSGSQLPVSQVQQLKNMRLATQLPVPVQGIKRHGLTEGLVADLRNNNLGGKVVWIMGPAGTWHYYAHLDDHKRGLSVGDYVKKGDLIGYVGNTGNARHTAPHLHYGLYLQGKGRGAVNPYPYLR